MEKLEKENINYIFPVIKGSIISVILTVIMIFFISIALCKTDLKESMINPLIIFASSFSILIGGFISAKKLEKNGIIIGAMIGLIYILSIYIISSILSSSFVLNINSIILIICSIVCGSIGGIIGVNIK